MTLREGGAFVEGRRGGEASKGREAFEGAGGFEGGASEGNVLNEAPLSTFDLRHPPSPPRPRWSPEGLGPNPEKVGARRVGARKGWGPEGWGPKGGVPNPEKVGRRGGGPEGWGPEGWGAQNFALFFPSPAHKIRSFLPSLGVFSWNFGGVSSAGALKCARLEFSGCRVRAPAARSDVLERRSRQSGEGKSHLTWRSQDPSR